MKPYYEQDGMQIFHGRAEEVCTEIPDASVVAVITDPPYTGLKGSVSHSLGGVAPRRQPTQTLAEPWGNDLSALSHCRRTPSFT